MERQVIYRDYQEEQAVDHNDAQTYARESLDHVVNDAVTAGRRYAGFNTTKSAQTEVTVAAGRMYDAGGAVFVRSTALVQSMVAYLAAAAQRIVSISAYGSENETDVQERDFLINVDTGATEPDSIAMTRSRDAVLVFTLGAESADPQPPALPATHVEIARVLVDPIQVVSITMLTANVVNSTDGLNARTNSLEAFKTAIEPRVTSLASDLTALAQQVAAGAASRDMSRVFQDLARLKEVLEIPDTASDYGADRFLTDDESDIADAQALGFDARIDEGVRFADANADEFELTLFSANDPNAALSGGFLLPAHDDVLKLGVTAYHSDLGMAQYGFQAFDLKQLAMSRQRLRYGSVLSVCTNGAWWKSGTYDSVTGTFKKAGETFEVLNLQVDIRGNPVNHTMVRLRQVWIDVYQEPYWGYVVTDHAITGAQVAQTFLNANDMWLTKVGFYLTSKAAAENVFLTICRVVNGQPDLGKVVLQQTVAEGALVVNDWTRGAVAPTFLRAGERYALVLTSNANHKVGMAYGQTYLDGTFFYSTDGSYYQGDLTKDMMFELWGAKFDSPQVAIELDALNLDGGMRTIDILAAMVVPQSTDLVFEVQPGGAGDWKPLNLADATAFTGAPVLARFRARFIGTRDIHPGIMLTGSRCRLSRPKTQFTHVSTGITLASGSNNISVKCLIEGFDETPHDFGLTLRHDGVTETPDTTVDVVLPDLPDVSGRIERTFIFQFVTPTTAFTLIGVGTTNSAANTFHWSERVHWAV